MNSMGRLFIVVLLAWAAVMAIIWPKQTSKVANLSAPPSRQSLGEVTDLKALNMTPLSGGVFLTFDDGPSPVYTPQVLAILKKEGVKATFFLIGKNITKYPALVKEIDAAGHAIACHSVNHKNLTILSREEMHAEVKGCQQQILAILGKQPRCFRPPYNKTNNTIDAYIESQNMQVVRVGLDTWDWENPGVDRIVFNTLCLVKPGTTITLHDGQLDDEDHTQSLIALKKIVVSLKKRGLSFEKNC